MHVRRVIATYSMRETTFARVMETMDLAANDPLLAAKLRLLEEPKARVLAVPQIDDVGLTLADYSEIAGLAEVPLPNLSSTRKRHEFLSGLYKGGKTQDLVHSFVVAAQKAHRKELAAAQKAAMKPASRRLFNASRVAEALILLGLNVLEPETLRDNAAINAQRSARRDVRQAEAERAAS